VALTSVFAGRAAWHEVQADRCLDRGDVWFGGIGCRHRLARIDRIVIDKSARRLIAYEDGRAVGEMTVALGRQPSGDKERSGDDRTPEGVFPIVAHPARSGYHRALRLGYPTAAQAQAARRRGIEPGGDIMIHGIRNGLGWLGSWHSMVDWTHGCIAVSDGEIDWLYQAAADGTPVEIRA
jgi:murein L,D-transpeptidase YafK